MIMTFQNKRILGIGLAIVLLLMIPQVAMQFSDEVAWSTFDFLLMGGLLTAVGLAVEISLRILKTSTQRLIVIAVVFILFLVVWIELAVGVFGTPFAGS